MTEKSRKELLRKKARTTIQLKKEYFGPMKTGEKVIHIDNQRRGIEEGDIVRFTNGYDPENGEIFRYVYEWERIDRGRIDISDLVLAQVKDLEWFMEYADDKVYLFYLCSAVIDKLDLEG